MASPDYDLHPVLVLDTAEQVRAMTQPLRFAILGALQDKAMTAVELAAAVATNKGSAHHHLRVLEVAGLVRVVRTTAVRGGTQQYWGRTASAYDLQLPDGDMAGRAELLRTIAGELTRSPEVTQSLQTLRLRLPPDAQVRLQARLDEVIAEARENETGDGVPLRLTLVLFEAT